MKKYKKRCLQIAIDSPAAAGAGTQAKLIAKDIKIRKLAHNFQMECAYNPSKKYKGSIIDGRDITYNIMPEADFKFFITASSKTRALRRYMELKELNKKISLNEVLKSIKKRDKSDYNRKVSPLKRTKDQYLISSENESKRSCFLKIKQIIDKKLTLNGNIQ